MHIIAHSYKHLTVLLIIMLINIINKLYIWISSTFNPNGCCLPLCLQLADWRKLWSARWPICCSTRERSLSRKMWTITGRSWDTMASRERSETKQTRIWSMASLDRGHVNLWLLTNRKWYLCQPSVGWVTKTQLQKPRTTMQDIETNQGWTFTVNVMSFLTTRGQRASQARPLIGSLITTCQMVENQSKWRDLEYKPWREREREREQKTAGCSLVFYLTVFAFVSDFNLKCNTSCVAIHSWYFTFSSFLSNADSARKIRPVWVSGRPPQWLSIPLAFPLFPGTPAFH